MKSTIQMSSVFLRVFFLNALLALFAASCTTTNGSLNGAKNDAKLAPNKIPPAREFESFALWEPGTKMDRDVLRRGAKARGKKQNGY